MNVAATAHLADACREANARLVYVSTDLVFDGERGPYGESATPAPLSVYGRTKLDGEHEVALRTPNHVIVRTSLLFGPTLGARRGFFDQQVDALRACSTGVRLFDDEWRTPLALCAAAEGIVAIATDRHLAGTTLHLAGPERLSRLEMGERLARYLRIDPGPVFEPASRLSVDGEPRARDVSLDATAFHDVFPRIAMADFESECRTMGVR